MAHTPAAEPWSHAERAGTVEAALDGADAAMLVTDWPQLRDVDWAAAAASMNGAVFFDGRNLLDPEAMARAGFVYLSVGRASTRPR